MRQYRKGKRLLALNAQKTQGVQRHMAHLQTQKNALTAQISQFDAELAALAKALIGLHIEAGAITRSDIYRQRRKQVLLLRQRQQVMTDRALRCEELAEVSLDITMQQSMLAELKRKEAKFTRWTLHSKRVAVQQQDQAAEDEVQDMSVVSAVSAR